MSTLQKGGNFYKRALGRLSVWKTLRNVEMWKYGNVETVEA